MVDLRRGGRGSDPTTPVPAPTGLRWLVVALLAAVVLAVVPPLVGGWTRQPELAGPVEVVEQFFTAITDGDLDRALGYVVAVPYGSEAALLRPEAVDGGWRLLAAHPADRTGGGYGTWVQVMVGDGRSQATGWVEVSQDEVGHWWLVDPLVTIEVASVAPLTYLQVNGAIVELTELYAADPLGAGVRYRLLPGPYSFSIGCLAWTPIRNRCGGCCPRPTPIPTRCR